MREWFCHHGADNPLFFLEGTIQHFMQGFNHVRTSYTTMRNLSNSMSVGAEILECSCEKTVMLSEPVGILCQIFKVCRQSTKGKCVSNI